MPSCPQPTAPLDPPLERPLLLFDGDCGFCRRWVARWHRLAKGRVDVAPAQQEGARFPHVPASQHDESVVLIEPDGTTTVAGEAAIRMLELGGVRWPAWIRRRVPGASALVEAAYRLVARHRGLLSRVA